MKEEEGKAYGSEEIKDTKNHQALKYDTDILGQDIIITKIEYLGEWEDSHGTKREEWLLTVFLGENHRQKIRIISHHAFVREVVKHFVANPDRSLRCRIITQGEAQAKRYRLAEPKEEEKTE